MVNTPSPESILEIEYICHSTSILLETENKCKCFSESNGGMGESKPQAKTVLHSTAVNRNLMFASSCFKKRSSFLFLS